MNKLIKESDTSALIGRALRDYSGTDLIRALAMLLLAHAGARSNEVLRLKAESIEIIEDGETVSLRIFIEASKNGKSRWIPLPLYLLAPVKDLRVKLQSRNCQLSALIGLSSTSLETAYELCRLYFNKIQLELFGEQRYTLHAFRHTLATLALASGEYNLVQVKTLLGHRSIQSTMRYLEEYENGLVLKDVHLLIKQGA